LNFERFGSPRVLRDALRAEGRRRGSLSVVWLSIAARTLSAQKRFMAYPCFVFILFLRVAALDECTVQPGAAMTV
jgi:hypothetical protein